MPKNGNNVVSSTSVVLFPSDLYYGYEAFIDELKAL